MKKNKMKVVLILIAATASCFGLSIYFSSKANLGFGFPYPINIGSKYLSQKPKIQMSETRKSIPVLAGVLTLQIEGVQADITLLPSQSNQVEVSLVAGVDRPLTVDQDGTTLTLKVEGKNEGHVFNLFTPASPMATLEVKIPKGIPRLKIDFIAANIKGEGFKFETLDVSNTSGDIKFTKTTSLETKLHSVSGWVGLEGSFPKLEGDLISGDFRVYLSDLKPEVKLHTVSGGIKVQIPEKANATVEASFVSGRFTIRNQGPKKFGGRGQITFGKGEGSIHVDTVSGDVSID
jgi:DUF4097 and DUF4098 domain-containing protein YvlB